MNQRCKTFMQQFDALGIDAALVSSYENVRYLSGFTNTETLLVLDAEEQWLLTDSRYSEQAEKQCPDFTVIKTGHGVSLATELKKRNEEGRCLKIGFEADRQTVSWYHEICAQLPQAEFLDLGQTLNRQREIKDAEEIENIRQAQRVTDDAFAYILSFIRPGMEELEIKAELEYFMAKQGCENSFGTIVASGPNSSMPHAQPSHRKVQAGDFITMDFGCKFNGYCSDMTRTIALGTVSDDMKKIYEIVLEAQKRTLDKIHPGMICNNVDYIARGYIDEMGYGDCFEHGLGHSFGLMIHEDPRFSPSCEDVLRPGMSLSVEPGIYLPGKFGVRIEDTICITEDGFENFTASPKELIIL